jgi:hypothetical protein
MKNYRSIVPFVLIFTIITVALSSCMMTRTPVGTYSSRPGLEYIYAEGKQVWLFWGLVPLGRTHVPTPADGNCEIITHYTFGDMVIHTITLGVVRKYTIKVRAKRNE